METAILAIIVAGFIGVTASHEASGFRDTGCDAAHQTPVISDRTGEILYWNNATCPARSRPNDAAAVEVPEDDAELDAS